MTLTSLVYILKPSSLFMSRSQPRTSSLLRLGHHFFLHEDAPSSSPSLKAPCPATLYVLPQTGYQPALGNSAPQPPNLAWTVMASLSRWENKPRRMRSCQRCCAEKLSGLGLSLRAEELLRPHPTAPWASTASYCTHLLGVCLHLGLLYLTGSTKFYLFFMDPFRAWDWSTMCVNFKVFDQVGNMLCGYFWVIFWLKENRK